MSLSFVDDLPAQLLGCHIADGATSRSAEARGARERRHTEVCELHVPVVVDEDVAGLDIEVEHAVFVRERERLHERVGDGWRIRRR